MLKFVSATGLLAALALGGCAGVPCGDPHAYQTQKPGAPLKVPAGMQAPQPDSTYAIPGEANTTGKRTDLDATGACLVHPPQLIKPPSSANPTPESVPVKSVPAAGTHAKPAVASGEPIG